MVDSNKINILIQNEEIKPKSGFEKNKLIFLNHKDVRNVDLIVERILFEDGSIWTNKESNLEKLN